MAAQLSTKINLAILIPVLVALSVGCLCVIGLAAIRSETRQTTTDAKVLQQISHLIADTLTLQQGKIDTPAQQSPTTTQKKPINEVLAKEVLAKGDRLVEHLQEIKPDWAKELARRLNELSTERSVYTKDTIDGPGLDRTTSNLLTSTVEIASGATQDAAQSARQIGNWIRAISLASVVSILISVLVGLLAPLVTRQHIIQPLRRTTSTMRQLAAGNTNAMVTDTDRSDSIGAMAKAVQVFKDNMIAAEKDRVARSRAEAKVREKSFQLSQSNTALRQVNHSLEVTVA
ncbi:MAG: HAMP domain-containing protein, partial [Pseudomonadota bacterium]